MQAFQLSHSTSRMQDLLAPRSRQSEGYGVVGNGVQQYVR